MCKAKSATDLTKAIQANSPQFYHLGSVQNAPQKFESAQLFPRLVRRTVYTNPYRKRPSNRKNLKTPAFFVSVLTERILIEAFRTRWRHYNHVMSLSEFSSNRNPKWQMIIVILNSHVDAREHLMRFQSETYCSFSVTRRAPLHRTIICYSPVSPHQSKK